MTTADPILAPVVSRLLATIAEADAGPTMLEENVDPVRFPEGYGGPLPETAPARLAELLEHAAGFQTLYERLDDQDRELMCRVLAFRVLGPRKVRLPMTLDGLLANMARTADYRVAERTAALGIFDWYADDYDLTELGFPLRLTAHAAGIVQLFLAGQYDCADVPVRSGDVVIDGGGCWGDTALYFSHLAGPDGRVVSYEFEPGNLELLRHNLRANPEAGGRVDVVERALWHTPGERLAFRPFGPGTTLADDGESSVETDTIDALVARGAVDRVDFIKLDVEGAELSVLRGAEATLRSFRPRLALAAYHRADDLAAIPAYLAELGVGYRFRLAHTTMHGEETMLFATAAEEPASGDAPAGYAAVVPQIDALGGPGAVSVLDVGSGSVGLGRAYDGARFAGYDREFAAPPAPGMVALRHAGPGLPFADHAFDVVVCVDGLDRLQPADPTALIFDLCRVAANRVVVAAAEGHSDVPGFTAHPWPNGLVLTRDVPLAALVRGGVEIATALAATRCGRCGGRYVLVASGHARCAGCGTDLRADAAGVWPL